MTLTFCVCHVKISENGGSFRGMRVFDKDHNFIGTVTRRELKLLSRENNGIMPVTVSMTPVEDRQMPKGNQVIAVGSLAGAFAALLHFLFRLIPVPEYMAVWNILGIRIRTLMLPRAGKEDPNILRKLTASSLGCIHGVLT